MDFDHTAFQVSDIDLAIKWYVQKLNFKFLFQGINEGEKEAYSFLSYGNSKLELIQDLVIPFVKPEIKKPFCPHLCLKIDDMEVGLKFLKQNNIPILRGPMLIENEETWVYFADPDNNVLEFIQWFNQK